MSRKATTLQAPPVTGSSTHTAPLPTEQAIAFRAHEIFLERGAVPGHELDDWLQAERELTAAKPSAPPQQSAPSTVPFPNPRSPR
jgi:hypothetical protein